jgi:hypothetical protein
MITAKVTVKVDRAQMRAVTRRDGIRYINDVNDAVADRAKRLAPRGRGTLRASIRTEPAVPTGQTKVTGRVVALARHAVWVHEGTGIYGPRHHEIEPRTDEVLRFVVPGTGVVYARQVRGIRPTKYLTRALDQVLSQPPWRIEYFTTPFP